MLDVIDGLGSHRAEHIVEQDGRVAKVPCLDERIVVIHMIQRNPWKSSREIIVVNTSEPREGVAAHVLGDAGHDGGEPVDHCSSLEAKVCKQNARNISSPRGKMQQRGHGGGERIHEDLVVVVSVGEWEGIVEEGPVPDSVRPISAKVGEIKCNQRIRKILHEILAGKVIGSWGLKSRQQEAHALLRTHVHQIFDHFSTDSK